MLHFQGCSAAHQGPPGGINVGMAAPTQPQPNSRMGRVCRTALGATGSAAIGNLLVAVRPPNVAPNRRPTENLYRRLRKANSRRAEVLRGITFQNEKCFALLGKAV